MNLQVNYLRIYRDVCDKSDLSLGALGVLAVMLSPEYAQKPMGPEELCACTKDEWEYINELKNKEYIDF